MILRQMCQKLDSYVRFYALFIFGFINFAFCYPTDDPRLQNLPPDADVIEIVDYEKNAIVGYMVLRNGVIIRNIKITDPSKAPEYKQSQPITNNSKENLESKSASKSKSKPKNSKKEFIQAYEQAYVYEEKISSAPPDKKSKISKKKKGFITSDSIEQEQGREGIAVNKTFKDREWNKKKIPHDVTTKVLDIGNN